MRHVLGTRAGTVPCRPTSNQHEDCSPENTHIRSGLIPLSVCAVLMLAACGSDESVSSPTDPTLQPPVAVNVVGSGGDTAEAASTEIVAQDARAGAADADRSIGLMPAFGGYVFEAGEDLPALPTNSTGYHFPAGATVDAADVSRIAAALGVEGERAARRRRQRLSMAGRARRRHAHRHCSWPTTAS